MRRVRIELTRLHEVLSLLETRWPRTFFRYEKRRKPLKTGIDKDIAAALGDSVTPIELEAALCAYVSNIGYLDNSYVNAPRIDLDGNEVGSVTPEQAVRAAACVVLKIRRRAAAKAKAQVSDAAARTARAGVTVSAAPGPARLSLSDLKIAAARRRASSAAA